MWPATNGCNAAGHTEMRRLVLTAFAWILVPMVERAIGPSIDPDEEVVFFPTFAVKDGQGHWRGRVHGWIFEPEENSIVREQFVSAVRGSVGPLPDAASEQRFERRVRAFLVDNERRQKIQIRIDEHQIPLEESAPNGHFFCTVSIPDEWLSPPDSPSPGPRILRYRAVVPADDPRVFEGEIHLLGPTAISVISDVDDTIKISEVLDGKRLLANTFVHEYRAVPGMAQAYQRWSELGASFHYVSASPWQLYSFLRPFTAAGGFPAGTWHMKTFRAKDSSVMNLFDSPMEYKVGQIEAVMAALPLRSFILVGDSGEQDPEAYGEIARRHQDRVRRIFIRDITGEGQGSPRMQKAFTGLPVQKWTTFSDAEGLALQLTESSGF